MMQEAVALDADRLLINLLALNVTRPAPDNASLDLLCGTTDGLSVICSYPNFSVVMMEGGANSTVPFQGDLIWSVIDTDHIMYSHTLIDRVEEEDSFAYHLIAVDLSDMSTDTLTVPWNPKTMPQAVKTRRPYYNKRLDRHFKADPVIQEVMDAVKVYPPLKDLRVDRGIVFGFHFAPTDSFGNDFEKDDIEVEPHLVDIIDLATGNLLARAEFPFLPEVIRDGMAYRLYTPENDFPAVYSYRIDPALYERRERQY